MYGTQTYLLDHTSSVFLQRQNLEREQLSEGLFMLVCVHVHFNKQPNFSYS